MKLYKALEKIELDYNVRFETRDHFQNFILIGLDDTADDYTELNYFSISEGWDGVEVEAANWELLLMDLKDLKVEFKGAYAYLWPYYHEFLEALKEFTPLEDYVK